MPGDAEFKDYLKPWDRLFAHGHVTTQHSGRRDSYATIITCMARGSSDKCVTTPPASFNLPSSLNQLNR